MWMQVYRSVHNFNVALEALNFLLEGVYKTEAHGNDTYKPNALIIFNCLKVSVAFAYEGSF